MPFGALSAPQRMLTVTIEVVNSPHCPLKSWLRLTRTMGSRDYGVHTYARRGDDERRLG